MVSASVVNSSSPVFGLAPMEGVSDWALRLWMSQVAAPSFMCTPFLRATDTFPKQLPDDFAPELKLGSSYELIPQVMASRPQDFVRAARLFLDAGAEFVDLNCGCPSPNPVSGGAGSSLLKDVDSFRRFVETIAQELPPERFSVKMRTGFDNADAFFDLVAGLRDFPLRQLTVHGRSRSDRYDGDARWDLIAAARHSLPYPVVASGDILSWETWKRKQAVHPAIERVIIGRGALRNPWIFTELRQGTELRISRMTLLYALASYAYLTEIAERDFAHLESLVRGGLFQGSQSVEESVWREFWRHLAGAPLEPWDLATDRFAFGRLKMIWNSLRSSLPDPFFEPTLLRQKTIGEFFQALSLIGSEEFVIRHNPNWDWLYTSSKKKPSLA